jgi:hypothetical protein
MADGNSGTEGEVLGFFVESGLGDAVGERSVDKLGVAGEVGVLLGRG